MSRRKIFAVLACFTLLPAARRADAQADDTDRLTVSLVHVKALPPSTSALVITPANDSERVTIVVAPSTRPQELAAAIAAGWHAGSPEGRLSARSRVIRVPLLGNRVALTAESRVRHQGWLDRVRQRTHTMHPEFGSAQMHEMTIARARRHTVGK